MKKKDFEKLVESESLNEHMSKKFNTEIGQKISVERERLDAGAMAEFDGIVRQLGKAVADPAKVPKGMEYLGSVAVHIYAGYVSRSLAVITQNALGKTELSVALKAMADARGSIIETYGRKRQKLRSGF